jgi:hypothetical protein
VFDSVKQSGPIGIRCQTVWLAAGEAILDYDGWRLACALCFFCVARGDRVHGAVVSLGGLYMFIHTLGKHPICHASRLQHGGLGSHFNLNFICAEKARTTQAKQA